MSTSRAGAPIDTPALVVGAGPAGLAVSACLRQVGVAHVLLERERTVAATWRRHYDRLHLHTHRDHSALPGLAFPRSVPRYPSRDEVVAYLEAYAQAFSVAPRLGEEVTAARRAGEGGWDVEASAGRYRARALVLATGANAVPVRPRWPGLDAYRGPVLHSAEYRSGARFGGADVLVVGLGNSGGEIAIDLVEHGARPTLSVRGPVNVVPRDLLGVPILTWASALSALPPRAADAVAAPLVRAALGDLRRVGLSQPDAGPLSDLQRRGRVPLIDVGTVALLRRGLVRLRPGIARFTEDGAAFVDGSAERFEAVVLATGFRHGLAELVADPRGVLDGAGRVVASGREVAPGLWLCGLAVRPGMLRVIGQEARRVADEISRLTTPRRTRTRGTRPRAPGCGTGSRR